MTLIAETQTNRLILIKNMKIKLNSINPGGHLDRNNIFSGTLIRSGGSAGFACLT